MFLGGADQGRLLIHDTFNTDPLEDRVNWYLYWIEKQNFSDAEIRAAVEAKFGPQSDVNWTTLRSTAAAAAADAADRRRRNNLETDTFGIAQRFRQTWVPISAIGIAIYLLTRKRGK